jgi:protein-disulfide isomerase
MPLSMHSKAQAAHEAAEAANQQGKFWEMHDLIFKNQREMSPENYLRYAAELELDVEKFKRDLTSKAVKTRIADDLKAAGTLGVTGTPSFFVNGRFLSGAQPFSAFKTLIDGEIAKN